METYKTFKSSNKENEVKQFENQFGNITTLVVINNAEYSVEVMEDLEEMKEEFFFEYGKNETSEKAYNLIINFLNK